MLKQSREREAASQRSQYPPYHPKFHAMVATEGDDDDIPLAQIRDRSVHLRRGSEGFEVRPRADFNSEEDSSDEEATSRSDWEEMYQRRQYLHDSGSDD